MVEKSHALSSQIRRSWNFAHVMIREIKGKEIFRDTLDPKGFVTRLGDLSKQTRTRILAWPFLENHVHGFSVESMGLRWRT